MAEYLCEEDMSTGEYISRDEALKIFHQYCDNCLDSYNGVMCRSCADADAMDILIDMPAADVQPVKRGTWLQHGRPDDYFWCCSACQKWIIFAEHDLHKHHFCGNCGARMDGDVE